VYALMRGLDRASVVSVPIQFTLRNAHESTDGREN